MTFTENENPSLCDFCGLRVQGSLRKRGTDICFSCLKDAEDLTKQPIDSLPETPTEITTPPLEAATQIVQTAVMPELAAAPCSVEELSEPLEQESQKVLEEPPEKPKRGRVKKVEETLAITGTLIEEE